MAFRAQDNRPAPCRVDPRAALLLAHLEPLTSLVGLPALHDGIMQAPLTEARTSGSPPGHAEGREGVRVPLCRCAIRAYAQRAGGSTGPKGLLWEGTCLSWLGHKTYAAYLDSPLWKSIRGRVLKRDKGRCRGCGKRAWQIHHGAYDLQTMRGQDLRRLYALCGGCHQAISFTALGTKRPVEEVREMTEALGKSPGKPKARRRRRPGRPKKLRAYQKLKFKLR